MPEAADTISQPRNTEQMVAVAEREDLINQGLKRPNKTNWIATENLLILQELKEISATLKRIEGKIR